MTMEVNGSQPAAAAVLETSAGMLADLVLNSSLLAAAGADPAGPEGAAAPAAGDNLTHVDQVEVEPGGTVQCGLFFIIIYGPLYIVVCIFGLIGNSLSFAVLHKYSRSNVSTFLLKALAVSDNLFLMTALSVQTMQAMLMWFNKDILLPIYPYIQSYVWPVIHMIQMGTVWMMVLIATNRYIAVCKPLHAPRLCTKRNVKVQILIMTLFIIAYNIPRFFEYDMIYVNVTNAENITETQEINLGLQSKVIYNILYENVSYCLFVFLIPLIVLVVLNVHLVRELKAAQKSREALTSRTSTEENNITLVMIVIILVFIVCQTPSALNQILYYIVDDKQKLTCSSYMKYYHICNLLIIMNSSMNFVIYCVFRRQFQQDLWALFRGRPPRQRNSTIKRIHTNSFRSSSHAVKSPHTQESVPLTSSTCCTELGGNATTPTGAPMGDGDVLLDGEKNHVNNVTSQHSNNHGNNLSSRWS